MKKINLTELIEPVISIAVEAGHAIQEIYHSSSSTEVMIKEDKTPLTRADLQAHQIIVEGLKKLNPEIPILSEEAADIPYTEREQWQCYWLVDPLDGTKEFIHRTDEFTVNIALIVGGQSHLGVIYAPEYQTCYFASKGGGSFVRKHQITQAIHCRPMPTDQPCVVTLSRRHGTHLAENFLQDTPKHHLLPKGSSLKSCVIAEGGADIYPCLGVTSEWDMGAAQCIIEEAGGMMVDTYFNPIRFNQKSSLKNPPLLVIGDPDYNWQKLLINLNSEKKHE